MEARATNGATTAARLLAGVNFQHKEEQQNTGRVRTPYTSFSSEQLASLVPE